MPSPTILFETQNLARTAGTGIATYARNLASVAKAQGYATGALFGVDVGLSAQDPMLNEIRLFDARKKHILSPGSVARHGWNWLTRDPFGVEPVSLAKTGIVVDPGSNYFSSAFDRTYAVTHLPGRASGHFLRYGSLLNLKNLEGVDLLHTTHPIALKANKVPTLCTIHDIVPLRLPYTTLDNKKNFYKLIRALVEKCDHIVTVSEYSKRDIMKYFSVPEDRITNTYQSVHIDPALTAASEEEVALDLERFFGLQYKEYFLFLGAIEPKKNIGRLIDAYASSGSKRPLVLAGGLGWQYDGDLEKINDERFFRYRIEEGFVSPQRQVRRVNYVPQRRLISLIRGARALLFPSVYEGFGLPVLEAQLLGTPVMTSNVSSLPEVAGDAAVQVNPYDIDAMAAAIRTLDNDGDLREELSRKGLVHARTFSPENYGKTLDALYKRFV